MVYLDEMGGQWNMWPNSRLRTGGVVPYVQFSVCLQLAWCLLVCAEKKSWGKMVVLVQRRTYSWKLSQLLKAHWYLNLRIKSELGTSQESQYFFKSRNFTHCFAIAISKVAFAVWFLHSYLQHQSLFWILWPWHSIFYISYFSFLCREQHEILAFVAYPCSFPDVWVIIDHFIVDQLPTSYSQYECFTFIANFLLLCAWGFPLLTRI